MHPDPRKKGNWPRSADLIAGNQDLLTQIFLLLPAKSLFRFKSVCKFWRTLISAASFPRLHLLSHSRRRPDRRHSFILGLSCVKSQYFLCSPTGKKLTHLPFPFDKARILQSSNGLLLLENGRRHCVLNPTTMQYRDLGTKYPNDECFLFFDPSKSEHYRVFFFQKHMDSFDVYDSATDNWAVRSNFPIRPSYGRAVSLGNCVVFFGYGQAYYITTGGKMYDIPPRPETPGGGCKNYIMESNGHLHYVRLSSTSCKKPKLDVYEMINRKWIHCKSADPDQLKAALGSERKVELLGMVREGRVEGSMFLVHVPGRIMIYRFSDRVCEVIYDFRSQLFCKKDEVQFRFKDAHLFVPSFAPT